MRKKISLVLVPLYLSLVPSISALAYALPGSAATASTPPPAISLPSVNLDWNDVLNNLSSPVQDFSKSLKSAANAPVPNFNLNTPTGLPPEVTSGAESAWNQFDAWLSGKIGFHVSAVFHFISEMVGKL